MKEEKTDSSSSQADLAESTRENFSGDDRPVTVEMLARNYAAMIEQQEVSMALFAAIMKTNPGMIFTDEITSLKRKLQANIEGLAADLSALNEGRDDE